MVEERERLELALNRREPAEDGERERKKIGLVMRDCMAPKSQPAGPACCLRDCKLSLRMQTDKQDRHHLPILPSTTATVVHTAPSAPLLFLPFTPFPGDIFCQCTCMYMKFLIYFLYLPPLATFFLSPHLFPIYEMSHLAVYLTSHCLMVCGLCVGSFPCFTSSPV